MRKQSSIKLDFALTGTLLLGVLLIAATTNEKTATLFDGSTNQTTTSVITTANQAAKTNAGSGASSSKDDSSSVSRVLDSNLAAACIGLIGGAVGFFIARYLDRSSKRRDEEERYCVLLESLANELEFYADKFGFLSDQLAGFIGGSGIVPSYTFYPNFLEQGKIRMNEFMRNSKLVKEVGHCHFELSHICERMENFKKQSEDGTSPHPMLIGNANGFKGLVDSNIPVFKTNALALRQEAKTVQAAW